MQKEFETNVVFVSNIDYRANREDFAAFFESICGPDCLEINERGNKMATILFDRETRRSRGIGFVTFKNAEDAAMVVEKARAAEEGGEGLVFNGRALKVVYAEKREPRND